MSAHSQKEVKTSPIVDIRYEDYIATPAEPEQYIDEGWEDEEYDEGFVFDTTGGDASTMTAMGFQVSVGNGGGGVGASALTISDPGQAVRRKVDKREAKKNTKDRADRATQDQVLDPRTRLIILKMLNQKILLSINGCISTGKEANVYYCTTSSGPGALKVYKTSILVFKDRQKYLHGEFRFRTSKNTKNPRKMVAWWAEKEMVFPHLHLSVYVGMFY